MSLEDARVLYVGERAGGRTAADLESRREGVTITRADRAGAALDRLGEVDCVVSGHALPDADGLEFLAAVRERAPRLPFVLFPGEGSEALARAAISTGADAYVPRDGPGDGLSVLLERVEALVGREGDGYRELFEAAPAAMSVRDPETGAFLDASDRYRELVGELGEGLPSAGEGAGESPDPTEGVRELLREVREEGSRTVEWTSQRRDGTAVRIEATLEPAAVHGRTRVLVGLRDVSDREEELERTNDLLKRTQELANVGGWEYDPDEGTFRLTDQARRICGLRDGESLDDDLGCFHPEDRSSVREALERAVGTGEPFDVEARVRTPGGERRWVRARGEPDRGGRRVRGAVQDVTDQAGRERALRELQRRTRDLMRAETPREIASVAVETAADVLGLPLSTIYLDDDGTLRPLATTETVRSASAGRPTYRPGDEGPLSAVVREARESGETVVVEDAEAIGLDAGDSPMRSGLVHPLGDHGVFVTSSTEPEAFDGTDTALAEMLATTTTVALDRAERQRRYDAIFNQTFQFTGLMEPDGTLLEANDTALEFVGLDREDVLGIPIWESPWFQYSEETRATARESVERARDGEFFRDEVTIVGAEGTMIIDYSVRPVTDENGDVDLLVPEGRDITELKEREVELERKNEQLEEFASVVSHDLQNPLSVAAGNLELAARECDSDYLEAVEEAHDRMASLIDDLLALAREGEPVDSVEPVRLEALARGAWGNVETDDAELRVESGLTFEADRGRVYQLFENLFRNSVEHGGADVTVTVGPLYDGFYVEDDGPGIPESERDRVFEAGYSTREEGTGFGLRIVERIATAHGWHISATEGESGGARFEVTGVDPE